MTVSTDLRRNSYTASGSDTFAYTFLTYDEDWLDVYVDDVLQTITTHYTVTGVANPSGGNVVFVAAPDIGATVLILRTVPRTQLIDYQDGSKFPADSHEQALDKLTMIDHQYDESNEFSFGFAETVGDVGVTELTETAADRANKLLGFDAAGDLVLDVDLGTWKDEWATGIQYVVGDVVIDGADGADTRNIYRCQEAHVSGVWATDLAAAKWVLMIDVQAQLLATLTLTSTPADGEASGYIADAIFGGGRSKYDFLYINNSGKVAKANADSDNTVPCIAMAMEDGVLDEVKSCLWWGWVTNSGWSWTPGAALYLSTDVGEITETPPSGSGDIVQVVGIAFTATTIFFKPDFTTVEIA